MGKHRKKPGGHRGRLLFQEQRNLLQQDHPMRVHRGISADLVFQNQAIRRQAHVPAALDISKPVQVGEFCAV